MRNPSASIVFKSLRNKGSVDLFYDELVCSIVKKSGFLDGGFEFFNLVSDAFFFKKILDSFKVSIEQLSRDSVLKKDYYIGGLGPEGASLAYNLGQLLDKPVVVFDFNEIDSMFVGANAFTDFGTYEIKPDVRDFLHHFNSSIVLVDGYTKSGLSLLRASDLLGFGYKANPEGVLSDPRPVAALSLCVDQRYFYEPILDYLTFPIYSSLYLNKGVAESVKGSEGFYSLKKEGLIVDPEFNNLATVMNFLTASALTPKVYVGGAYENICKFFSKEFDSLKNKKYGDELVKERLANYHKVLSKYVEDFKSDYKKFNGLPFRLFDNFYELNIE